MEMGWGVRYFENGELMEKSGSNGPSMKRAREARKRLEHPQNKTRIARNDDELRGCEGNKDN